MLGTRRILVLTVAALAAGLVLASSASARTFTVTRADDPTPGGCKKGDCSLREAALAAGDHAGADTIVFAKRLLGEPILLGGSSIEISRKLTIAGPGAADLTISGNDQSRIFHMTGGRVDIRGVAITAGRETSSPTGAKCPGSSASGYQLGGGILQDKGTLSLDRVQLTDNAIMAPDNTIIGGGGVAMIEGSLSITRSKLRQNNLDGGAITEGGAIYACAGELTVVRSAMKGSSVSSHAIADGGGFGIGREGEITIGQSTMRNNTVTSEAIADGGGGFTAGAPVTIKNSTISNNTASAPGTGDIADAGGFLNANAQTRIVNSTIADNTATGYVADGGGITSGGTGEKLILRSVTLVGNVAAGSNSSRGGNLLGADSASLMNTIVAEGQATTGSNCDAPVKSSSHDLEDQDTCGFNGPGDLVNKNPKLRPLGRNGGPTETIALKAGSPAIDHASRKTSPKRDQRGFVRVGRPDIGAFEFGAKP
jgi:hypothetical protein